MTDRELPRTCRVHICGFGECFTCTGISPFQNPHPLRRRPAAEVVQASADVKFAGDLARAVSAERERAAILPPEPDLAREMNDWRDWEGSGGA